MRLPKLIKDTILQSKSKAGNHKQYRTILSAVAAGAVLKPSGGNCAVLP